MAVTHWAVRWTCLEHCAFLSVSHSKIMIAKQPILTLCIVSLRNVLRCSGCNMPNKGITSPTKPYFTSKSKKNSTQSNCQLLRVILFLTDSNTCSKGIFFIDRPLLVPYYVLSAIDKLSAGGNAKEGSAVEMIQRFDG